jgi:Copper transport outer membrane protein, MctB
VISFRYHIVTIVAVFLALAIGLLAGSAFVQPELQRELEDQTAELQRANADLREALTEVRAEVAALDRFAEATLPYLTSNRLAGTQVVVVSQEGVEDAVLGQTQRSLVESGAEVLAVLSARNELASQDPATQAGLAEILQRPDAVPEDLASLTATAIAERLALGNGIGSPSEDLLNELLSAGFLAPVGTGVSEAALQEIGAPGQVVVVLGGGSVEEPVLPLEEFGVPLVRSLSSLEVPVAAGESSTTLVPFVGLIREDGTDGAVTVDDLDLSMGGAALVLGLEALLERGEGGAYGFKDGAEPLPPLTLS